mmetsp:Transcript_3639/g.5442  ORF Transcript_3639/g.5442 Transcript_3639/m.5442 type:complete len:250 (+) Transcript_3639:4169-4918(+)
MARWGAPEKKRGPDVEVGRREPAPGFRFELGFDDLKIRLGTELLVQRHHVLLRRNRRPLQGNGQVTLFKICRAQHFGLLGGEKPSCGQLAGLSENVRDLAGRNAIGDVGSRRPRPSRSGKPGKFGGEVRELRLASVRVGRVAQAQRRPVRWQTEGTCVLARGGANAEQDVLSGQRVRSGLELDVHGFRPSDRFVVVRRRRPQRNGGAEGRQRDAQRREMDREGHGLLAHENRGRLSHLNEVRIRLHSGG